MKTDNYLITAREFDKLTMDNILIGIELDIEENSLEKTLEANSKGNLIVNTDFPGITIKDDVIKAVARFMED